MTSPYHYSYSFSGSGTGTYQGPVVTGNGNFSYFGSTTADVTFNGPAIPGASFTAVIDTHIALGVTDASTGNVVYDDSYDTGPVTINGFVGRTISTNLPLFSTQQSPGTVSGVISSSVDFSATALDITGTSTFIPDLPPGVTITNPSSGAFLDSNVDLHYAGNNPAPSITLSIVPNQQVFAFGNPLPTTVVEPEGSIPPNVTVTVTRSGDLTLGSQVQLATTGGAGLVGPYNQTFDLLPGSTSTIVAPLQVLDDGNDGDAAGATEGTFDLGFQLGRNAIPGTNSNLTITVIEPGLSTPPPPPIPSIPQGAYWTPVSAGNGQTFVSPQFNYDPTTGIWSQVSPPPSGSSPYFGGSGGQNALDQNAAYTGAISAMNAWSALNSTPDAVKQTILGNTATASELAQDLTEFGTGSLEDLENLGPAIVTGITTGNWSQADAAESALHSLGTNLLSKVTTMIRDSVTDAVAKATDLEWANTILGWSKWAGGQIPPPPPAPPVTTPPVTPGTAVGNASQSSALTEAFANEYGSGAFTLPTGYNYTIALSGRGDNVTLTGNDTVLGVAGPNVITKNATGSDTIIGGSDYQTEVVYNSSSAGVMLTHSGATTTVTTSFGVDSLASVDWLHFSAGNNIFTFDQASLAAATAGVVPTLPYGRGGILFHPIVPLVIGIRPIVSPPDLIDLTALTAAAYNKGNGVPASSLVRANLEGNFVALEVNTNGNWVTLANFNKLSIGTLLNVTLDDSTTPITIPVQKLPASVDPTPPNDFNGDGMSDVLLQNNDGLPVIWDMNGTAIAGGGALPNPGPSWHIQASADFNQDGMADVVLQNTDGLPVIWEMNGTSIIGGGALPNSGPSWHVIATGDFNADGNPDILWQSADGLPVIWEMNGTSIIGSAALPNPGPSWRVIGTGDFNGDGKSDIILQNTDGLPVIWEMNGTSIIGGGALPNSGPSWHVIGTGDFNGDGKSDILWQSADGLPVIWEMNGTSIIGSAALPNSGPSWHAIGTSDFNDDDKSDIIWQNADGQPVIWEMNGMSIAGSAALPNPGPNWHPKDDGPIPPDQMASNATPAQPALHLSAPDSSSNIAAGASNSIIGVNTLIGASPGTSGSAGPSATGSQSPGPFGFNLSPPTGVSPQFAAVWSSLIDSPAAQSLMQKLFTATG